MLALKLFTYSAVKKYLPSESYHILSLGGQLLFHMHEICFGEILFF